MKQVEVQSAKDEVISVSQGSLFLTSYF